MCIYGVDSFLLQSGGTVMYFPIHIRYRKLALNRGFLLICIGIDALFCAGSAISGGMLGIFREHVFSVYRSTHAIPICSWGSPMKK